MLKYTIDLPKKEASKPTPKKETAKKSTSKK
jgi:hypothetical protein